MLILVFTPTENLHGTVRSRPLELQRSSAGFFAFRSHNLRARSILEPDGGIAVNFTELCCRLPHPFLMRAQGRGLKGVPLAQGGTPFFVVMRCRKSVSHAATNEKHGRLMIRRQRMPWTEQEDEALRGLSHTLSLPRLAIRLGRTQYAVKRRASDLRIKLLTKQDLKRRLNAAPAPALVAEEP